MSRVGTPEADMMLTRSRSGESPSKCFGWMHSHDLVQQLADDREERETDPARHAHLNHARDGASEEARGPLVPHHLHGAIDGALVQFLGRLALHAGLDAILRLREHYGS